MPERPVERPLLAPRAMRFARPARGAVLFVSQLLGRLVAYREDGDLIDLEVGHRQLRHLADASFSGRVKTTDATVTTCATWTPSDGLGATVLVEVVGRVEGGNLGGYGLAASVRRAGATTTQVGTTTALWTHENVAAWTATLNVSGTDLRVRVTGAAGTTIYWTARGLVVQTP